MCKDIVPEIHHQEQQVHLAEDVNTCVYTPFHKKKCKKEAREDIKSE